MTDSTEKSGRRYEQVLRSLTSGYRHEKKRPDQFRSGRFHVLAESTYCGGRGFAVRGALAAPPELDPDEPEVEEPEEPEPLDEPEPDDVDDPPPERSLPDEPLELPG